MRPHTAIALALWSGLVVSTLAQARVTRLETTNVQSPAFEGRVFAAGQYRFIDAVAHGELDPRDPLNAVIVNLDRAPKNPRGKVEYTVDVRILAPVDLAKGSRTILVDIPNRGNMRVIGVLNDAPTTNTPRLASDGGNGFLMDQGYAIVWVGWQGDIPSGAGRLTASLPVARHGDGTPIVGIVREEFVDTGTAPTFLANLTYPGANSSGTLTVRQNERDSRQTPSDLSFSFVNSTQIRINRPSGFDSGAIYEFVYSARDPIVMGIGFAATRDVVAFLRHRAADDAGAPNPLAVGGKPFMRHALSFGISQSGRYLRDFLYLGFNEDEGHHRVFDGIHPHIAGARRTFTNYPFAQPSRFSRQHEDHLFPGDQFPFSYADSFDPISGRRDGLLGRCRRSVTCPTVIQTDSESELWQARASLIVSDARGRPIQMPDTVRYFLLSGTQHIPASKSVLGICQFPNNTLPYSAELRALNVDLADWVRDGVEPPRSRYPTGFIPVADLRYPDIPGLQFNHLDNQLSLTAFETQPPEVGPPYPVLQAMVDTDGNVLGGLRHPFLSVPTATYSGWNVRSKGNAPGELCNSPSMTVAGVPMAGTAPTGMELPFAKTRNARLARNDPRLSLEERHPTHEDYVSRVRDATVALHQDRLLLINDAMAILRRAEAAEVP